MIRNCRQFHFPQLATIRLQSQWAVDIMNFLQGKKRIKIRQIGDPILREKAKPVDLPLLMDPSFGKMIDNLISEKRKLNAWGLSAPQIGESLQVIVFEVTGYDLKTAAKNFGSKGLSKMQMTLCPLTVLVNPKLKILDPTQIVLRESCASVKNYSALVPRAKEIKVTGLNREGEKIELHAHGWTARIIQHEIDHLQGNLYIDSMIYKSLRYDQWRSFQT